jgi:hypothetical protein
MIRKWRKTKRFTRAASGPYSSSIASIAPAIPNDVSVLSVGAPHHVEQRPSPLREFAAVLTRRIQRGAAQCIFQEFRFFFVGYRPLDAANGASQFSMLDDARPVESLTGDAQQILRKFPDHQYIGRRARLKRDQHGASFRSRD